jgi:hypothetical protein
MIQIHSPIFIPTESNSTKSDIGSKIVGDGLPQLGHALAIWETNLPQSLQAFNAIVFSPFGHAYHYTSHFSFVKPFLPQNSIFSNLKILLAL